MQNSILIKGFRTAQDLEAYQAVKFDASGNLEPSNDKADLGIGITGELGGKVNTVVDVILAGIAEIILADNVLIGAALSASSNGTAITATTTCRVIAIALKAGSSGDRIPVLLAPSQLA